MDILLESNKTIGLKVMPNLFRHPCPVKKLIIQNNSAIFSWDGILIRRLADRMTFPVFFIGLTE